MKADPSDLSVSGVGLRPFVCWNRGFESRLELGCSSLAFVVSYAGSGLSDELVGGILPDACV